MTLTTPTWGQFVVTRLILHGPNRAENLKTVALAVPKIFQGVLNFSLGQVTLTTPLQGRLVIGELTLDIAYNYTKCDDSS